MRQVELPDICSETLFAVCARRIKNKSHRTKLLSHHEEVSEFNDGYAEASKNQYLYQIVPAKEYWEVPRRTWNNLYENHMARPNAVGREEYDAIRLAPPADICPFCSVQTIRTVDHFLPKSKFPQFSISPANLVGCCRDCNTEKDTKHAENLESQLFQPYFEAIEGRWLSAIVREETPPMVSYQVDRTLSLDEITLARAENQFNLLKLGAMYASHAAQELSSIEFRLSILLENVGVQGIKEHLAIEATSAEQAKYPIEWKVALYEALSRNNWYCEGGFRFT